MPKPKTTNNARSVRRIAIDGHFLDEIRTRLQTPASNKSLTYTSAAVERHQVIADEEGVTLKVPVLTALQLYHDGVLSADPQKSVEFTSAARKLGAFHLHWLRGLPGDEFGNPVLLRFERKPSKKEQPYEANAWLTDLVALELRQQGEWDPAEEYWGEAGEPIEAWAKPIIKRGPRPMYEMEQILPGADPEDFDNDPIMEANELQERGPIPPTTKILAK